MTSGLDKLPLAADGASWHREAAAAEAERLCAQHPMKTPIHLDVVELLDSERIAVTIGSDPNGLARFIYRAAAEIDWEPETMRYLSPRPELGPPLVHFTHIAAAASDELGWRLYVSPATRWMNVPQGLRDAIEAVAPGA